MATITGTSGRDILRGTSLEDVISGYGGNDTIIAWGSRDRIYGGAGNDDIEAGYGNDYVRGGPGHDDIEGDDGNDWLYGGGGADVFEFDEDDGYDNIRDWQDGQDRIDLDDFDLSLSQVLRAARQVGDNVKFYLEETTIVVHNADRADFSGADFIL